MGLVVGEFVACWGVGGAEGWGGYIRPAGVVDADRRAVQERRPLAAGLDLAELLGRPDPAAETPMRRGCDVCDECRGGEI